jgi:hypothetical protein
MLPCSELSGDPRVCAFELAIFLALRNIQIELQHYYYHTILLLAVLEFVGFWYATLLPTVYSYGWYHSEATEKDLPVFHPLFLLGATGGGSLGDATALLGCMQAWVCTLAIAYLPSRHRTSNCFSGSDESSPGYCTRNGLCLNLCRRAPPLQNHGAEEQHDGIQPDCGPNSAGERPRTTPTWAESKTVYHLDTAVAMAGACNLAYDLAFTTRWPRASFDNIPDDPQASFDNIPDDPQNIVNTSGGRRSNVRFANLRCVMRWTRASCVGQERAWRPLWEPTA